MTEESSEARRALVKHLATRYDRCVIAHRAESASRVNLGDDAASIVFNRSDMLRIAVERHLRAAEREVAGVRPDRPLNLVHVADIAGFAHLMQLQRSAWWPVDAGRVPLPAALYDQALAAQDELSRDPNAYLFDAIDRQEVIGARIGRYRASRLRGQFDHLDDLLDDSGDDDLFRGSGCEHLRLEFECERILGLVWANRPAELDQWLAMDRVAELEGLFTQSGLLAKYRMTRALAEYVSYGRSLPDLRDQVLDSVLGVLENARASQIRFLLHELSIRLAAAEICAAADPADPEFGRQARMVVTAVTRLQGEWAVAARSFSPLAAVLRRCLGDVAALAARTGDAKLGFDVIVPMKQTAISHLLQNREIEFPEHIRMRLNDLAAIDARLFDAGADLVDEVRYDLARQRVALQNITMQNFHDTCLDYVYPGRVSAGDVRERLGARWGVEFVSCETNAGGAKRYYFRLEVMPNGRLTFAEIDLPDRRLREVADPDYRGDLADLTETLLSTAFLDELAAAAWRVDRPEVIISPDHDLSVVGWAGLPWPGVRGEQARPRLLIEDVTLALTPTLACLSPARPSTARGHLLAHLVAAGSVESDGVTPTERLDLSNELRAWGMDSANAPDVATYVGESGEEMSTSEVGLLPMLRDRAEGIDFVHVASHGVGAGLDNQLLIPAPFTAAAAFAVRWPDNVLLAACHVGGLRAARSEPLAFSVAVLVGGASCVVAASGRLHNDAASAIASSIITRIRAGSATSLPRLLADAQIEIHRAGKLPIGSWSHLLAYCD